MRYRFMLVTLGALLAQSALAAPDPATVKAVSTAYAARLFAQTYRDYCAAQAPASAAGVRQAYTAWVQAQGLGNLDAQLPNILNADLLAQLKSGSETARSGFVEALQKLGSPDKACAAYAQQLNTGVFNLKASVPSLSAVLGGAGSGSAAQSASGTAAPAGATTVYSVAQLTSLVGTVLDALPKNTPGSQQETAAMKKLASLGRPLVVSGTVDPEHGWLSQQDERHTARWNVYCYGFADENASFDPYHGKSVTVVGTLRDFDRDTFITLDNCRILASSAGLKKSSLPVSDAGWRFKAQPAEKFLVAAGQGVPDSQILGVYTQQISSVGVGGMMMLEFEPYLFFKDGSIYSDPYLAPGSFNAKLSRDLEPQKWGRWTRQGKNFLIRWGDGRSETFEVQFQPKPAAAGQRLGGSFSHLGGGGNTAVGGDTMVAVSSTYTFTPDGRLRGGSSASASTSSATTGNVTALSSQNTAGRYSLTGYNLTLRYDDGKEKRLLYYTVDDKMIHIGGADFLK